MSKSTAWMQELREKFYHKEQAEQRCEYLREGTFKNSIVVEKDIVNRWTDKVEHWFVVEKYR